MISCMRITLTLGDEVAKALDEAARQSGRSPEEVANELLRRQLPRDSNPFSQRAAFRVASARRGFLPGVDPCKLNRLVDELEVERFRRSSKS